MNDRLVAVIPARFARGLHEMDRDVRRGLWTKPDLLSLKECMLGVVGVGNIGTSVVRRACAFGMKVVGTEHSICGSCVSWEFECIDRCGYRGASGWLHS
jgi:phosphoglycerate dehydrogenase-like enzyme